MPRTSSTWSPSCKVSAPLPDGERLLKILLSLSRIFLPLIHSIYLTVSLRLSGYNDSTQQGNVDCPPGEYYIQDNSEVMTKKVCRFKRSALSLCSGLSDTNFGYSEGKPCVLLKMNRVTPTFTERFGVKEKKNPSYLFVFQPFFLPRQLLNFIRLASC